MRYHNITSDDMLNGEGIRVVLWLSGCEHKCSHCQNKTTWDYDSGLEFDEEAKKELFDILDKDYIAGVTLSGGDPLHTNNIAGVTKLIDEIKDNFSDKTVWLYTGYTWDEINKENVLKQAIQKVDVLVDGKFDDKLKDSSYHWAGSTNQQVIDINKTKETGEVVLYVHN